MQLTRGILMHYTLLETTAQITCTLEELVQMESLDQRIYAMPNLQGTVVQLYLANRPTSRDDFMLVDAEDFLAEMAFETLGPEESKREVLDALLVRMGSRETNLTVPRMKQEREA